MPIIGNPIYQSAFVVDQFSGNGSTVAFTMSVAPAGVTNVLVSVSGVLQDPSTYGVVGNTITFSAAPPSGTGNISCRYLGIPVTGVTTTAYRTVTEFTATASQTTFTPPSYTVGFINVYLNGVLLGSADYTATNGTTVVLTTGASAGNLLTVESFLVSSVLNAIPNTAGAVSSANIANDVTINFADGSASTPSITNNGDTNTGIFFPAADTIAFTEGGVESMRIDSSGNVGIGTTSPATKLHVAAETPTLRLDGTVATNSGARLQLLGWTGASKNWQIDTASTSTVNELAFAPSTANAGSTFTTASHIFTSNGTIGLTVSGSTSGAGITFPATQSASSNANTLDDYEEGTWTPTASTNITGTAGAGTYTKIGRAVFCRGNINVTAISGDFTITGLPFTNSANTYYTSAIPYFPPSVSITSQTGGQVNASATSITYYRTGTFSGGAQTCYFAFWYEV